MKVEEKREVGGEIKQNRLPNPGDRESGWKTTLITGEGSRGGSGPVKSGLISLSRRGSNYPSSTEGRAEWRGSERDPAGGWRAGQSGPCKQSLSNSPAPNPSSFVLAIRVGVLAKRLTG